jgi:hypothetical protein
MEDATIKVTKYNHVTAKPDTFARFRRLRNTCSFPGMKSDNTFLIELLRIYEEYLILIDKRKTKAGEVLAAGAYV